MCLRTVFRPPVITIGGNVITNAGGMKAVRYAHKEYNKIEDEEDDYYSEEDMKWDRLHKHGL